MPVAQAQLQFLLPAFSLVVQFLVDYQSGSSILYLACDLFPCGVPQLVYRLAFAITHMLEIFTPHRICAWELCRPSPQSSVSSCLVFLSTGQMLKVTQGQMHRHCFLKSCTAIAGLISISEFTGDMAIQLNFVHAD